MTLIAAIATRSSPDASSLLVLTDSRLSLPDGIPCDHAVKTLVLKRAAVALAGSSLPGMVAAEVARGEIELWGGLRDASDPMSLIEEAAVFYGAFRRAYAGMVRERFGTSMACEAVVAGWFADGTPGLVRLSLDPHTRGVSLLRPEPDSAAIVCLGDDYFAPIATAALTEVATKNPGDSGVIILKAISVLWDAIRHEGENAKGVGGGVSVGFSLSADRMAWRWPIVGVGMNLYHRGLPVGQPLPPEWEPLCWRIETDPHLFGRVERESAGRDLPRSWPEPVLIGADCRRHPEHNVRSQRDPAPVWALSDTERRALDTLGFAGAEVGSRPSLASGDGRVDADAER